MKLKPPMFPILLFSLILLASVPVNAAEVEGIYYEDSYVAGNTKLRLTGAGLLRYWGFRAYTGAFYLEDGASIGDVLADRAKRIELEYFRSIKGKDFGPATDKSIARNVDADTFNKLRPKIEYHNSLYVDVKQGDRYSLTYIPGRGTELALNGEPRGLIEGAEFAAAVFSIWLGPEPISSSFKDQILGDS